MLVLVVQLGVAGVVRPKSEGLPQSCVETWAVTQAVVIVSGFVPAVVQKELQAGCFREWVGIPKTSVIVWDRPCKQEAPGVVPVVLGLDHFCAVVGDEFTHI